jgi:hypothetical protein
MTTTTSDQIETLGEDEWVFVDHGEDGVPTVGEQPAKPSFLQALLKGEGENQKNSSNIQRVQYVGLGTFGIKSSPKTNQTVQVQAPGYDETEFAEEYYMGKKDRDFTRVQGIDRLPRSSKAAKDRRLTAKVNSM